MFGLFARKSPPRTFTLPPGERVYAIGDIHGRRDCLDTLIDRIDADDRARGTAQTTLIFLGDLVDRGPDSKAVVERAMELARTRNCRFLMGNHEELLINSWEGDVSATRVFDKVGGRETLLSYGADEAAYEKADFKTLTKLVGSHVPIEHIAFMREFGDSWMCGDYLFVHAGIRPGRPIEEQDAADMRWIRDKFLDDPRDHGAMVVHGHSIRPDVDEQPNRIGIDTGAYASGCLTALGLEGSHRWFLSSTS